MPAESGPIIPQAGSSDLRIWTADAPLTELSSYLDWDWFASMIGVLRIYLFEHRTIPTWNFAMCGGQPELAVPISWAWTWPSLVAYSLAPYPAILLLWIVLTLVGFVSLRGLLVRWTGSRRGATVGACVYAFSGYFAGHFNVGHVNFAFFHLVPAMMLIFEVGFARVLAAAPAGRSIVASTIVAFLFFTSAFPHALVYFYPAFVLLVAVRGIAAVRSVGAWRTLRAAAPLLAAQALGAWLAAYKLWPVIRWQLLSPRRFFAPESYGLGEILLASLRWIPSRDLLAVNPWQHVVESATPPWGPWELYAFVGAVPWLLAAIAVTLRLLGRSRTVASGPAGFDVAAYGLLLVVLGVATTLGSGHPASPAQWFGTLPLLSGVRAFGRFQILTVLGIASLGAAGFAVLERRWSVCRGRPGLLLGVAAAAATPVIAQAALLVWDIPATPKAKILARYGDPPHPDPPELVAVSSGVREGGHQTTLLESGYWIANCYTNLTVSGATPPLPARTRAPLSEPPPIALTSLAHDRLELAYAPDDEGWIRLRLRVLDGFEVDAPIRRDDAFPSIRRRDLVGGRLRIRAVYPGPREGLVATLAGVVVAALWAAAWRWRASASAPGAPG